MAKKSEEVKENKVVEIQERRPFRRDEWTLEAGVREGQELTLAEHRVEILAVLEEKDGYAICQIRPLHPERPESPPLSFHGERWDYEEVAGPAGW